MEAALQLLGSVPLFERLDPVLLGRLDSIADEVVAREGEMLTRQGEMPRHLHILLEGQVALSSTAADDTTAVVEVIHPVGHFVLASVLSELPYLMTARAVMRSRLIVIEAAPLLRLVETEPELASVLLRSVSRDFRSMVRQVRDLKLRTAAQRLGCYLLALVTDGTAARAELRLPFDKGLLAARLGCRQENLSRAFAALRGYGVETRGARVTLHDIPALKAFAVPDELSDPELL